MKKIFILHGWSYSTDTWKTFSDLLLREKVETFFFKIPGLTEKTSKVWTLEEYVKWLYKELGGQSNIILLGHSNGGRIALAFAEKYPQKVKKLILIDSAGIYHNELGIRIKRAIFNKIAKVGKQITSSTSLKRLLYKFVGESDYNKATPEMKATMVNLISVDLKPILNRILSPTLIVWGREDKITPLSDARIIHNQIKNSKLKIIDNAKHSPQFTHPEKVVELISNEL